MCACVMLVRLCAPKQGVGGGWEDLILVLLLWFLWLPNAELGTLLLGGVAKGEGW